VAGSRTCETATVVEPTVTLPLRARPPLFDATLTVKEPLPLPLAPDPIAIHDALADDDHEQSLSVDTLIDSGPPVCANEPPLGFKV
jgi:hypothetical protein